MEPERHNSRTFSPGLDAARRRALFEDMPDSFAAIYREPTFYNRLIDSCATNVVQHADEISAFKWFFDYRIRHPAMRTGWKIRTIRPGFANISRTRSASVLPGC